MGRRWRRGMIWLAGLLVVALIAWTAGSYAVIWNLEEAPYTVVERRDGFEIRDYPAIAIAETVTGEPGTSSVNEAFRRLARYIFGGNDADREIAMTAPVIIDETTGQTRMAFVLPKDIPVALAPVPRTETVSIREQAPQRVAAVRFSWFAWRSRREAIARDLMTKLEAAEIAPAGPAVYAAYNPPFSAPFMKRHEILIPIAR